jgi:hypothetical protein
VRRGSVLEASDVVYAVAGQDAVVSCVGAQRVDARNPWSPLRPPGRMAEASARLIAAACTRAGVHRVAAISAAGVGDSHASTNAMMRWLIRRSGLAGSRRRRSVARRPSHADDRLVVGPGGGPSEIE